MSLTDEDKDWIASQSAALRTDLTSRIDAVRADFRERIDAVRADFRERIDDLRTELTERIEKTETTLLTEFHRCASPVELRQRSRSAAMRAFDAELEAVSDRVTKIEHPNPPAA